MASIYDEQCATYPADPPRPDDKRYPPPEDTGKAQADGYTVVARRPFGSDNGTGWMDPEKADEYERMLNEYPDNGIGLGRGSLYGFGGY